MVIKRMTLRMSPDLHKKLIRLANDEEKSLNTLAVEALRTYADEKSSEEHRLPLRELSDLLAPAAEAANIEEGELLEHARSIRKRIWHERYAESVQQVRETEFA